MSGAIRVIRCWLCAQPILHSGWLNTALGPECPACTRNLATPLTPAERADYKAFKARADAQRAAKSAAVSLPGDEQP